MTLYVITHGCYSDYGISAIFDDKQMAEAYLATDSDAGIEEYELNPHADRITAGLKVHEVRMARDGTVMSHWESFGGDLEDDAVTRQWTRSGIQYWFVARIIAKTTEQAIKAANERRAIWIASGRPWPDDEPAAPIAVTSETELFRTMWAGSTVSTLGCTIVTAKESK